MGNEKKQTSLPIAAAIVELFFLPDDVVLEILPRLPAKSLLRFKCVSKSWNSFISSRDFSKTHLKYSNHQDRIMLLSKRYKNKFLKCFSLGEHPFLTELPVLGIPEFTAIKFIGSCHGLLCIVGKRHFMEDVIILWNPSTRETKTLPSTVFEWGYGRGRTYGFGFDESCDDYKVVMFYFCFTDRYDVLVKITSLKTGETKRIRNHDGCCKMAMIPPTFVNGKLHWFAETRHKKDLFIAYLDLTTEEYGILDKPDFVELKWPHLVKKAVFGRSLYVICYIDNVTNIWLLEPGYGIGKTIWTKVYSIPGIGEYFRYEGLLFVLENGEIVFLYGGKIEILDPSDRSVRYYELGTAHYFHTGIAYVESLVSPIM